MERKNNEIINDRFICNFLFSIQVAKPMILRYPILLIWAQIIW